jgi:hypothetical protein
MPLILAYISVNVTDFVGRNGSDSEGELLETVNARTKDFLAFPQALLTRIVSQIPLLPLISASFPIHHSIIAFL